MRVSHSGSRWRSCVRGSLLRRTWAGRRKALLVPAVPFSAGLHQNPRPKRSAISQSMRSSRNWSLRMWCIICLPGSWWRVHRAHAGSGPGPILKSDVLQLSLFVSRIRSLERRDRFFGRTGTKGSYWRMSNRVMVPRFRIPSLICGRERRCAKIEMFCFHVGTLSYERLQYTRADAKLNALAGVGRGDSPTERCGFTAVPARMLQYEWKRWGRNDSTAKFMGPESCDAGCGYRHRQTADRPLFLRRHTTIPVGLLI
jgi:hypothetical protein